MNPIIVIFVAFLIVLIIANLVVLIYKKLQQGSEKPQVEAETESDRVVVSPLTDTFDNQATRLQDVGLNLDTLPPDELILPYQPTLEFVEGPYSLAPVFVTKADFLIGRGTTYDCDLSLHDPKVSRRHAELRYREGTWYIQDQDSQHGVYVNNRLTGATRLDNGDRIQLGDTILRFSIQGSPDHRTLL